MPVITPVESTFAPHQIGAIRHTYHEHPLMQVDALAALAHRLMPLGNCACHGDTGTIWPSSHPLG